MARVLLMVSDLLMGSKIREAIAAAGHETVSVGSADAVKQALAAGPAALVLVDLSPRGADPLPGLSELKRGPLAAVPVIGYFSHVDTATRERAIEAGVEALPRSAFFGDLSGLIGRASGS